MSSLLRKIPARGLALSLFLTLPFAALAAPCSDTGGQYESWKPLMAEEAKAAGVGRRGIEALMATS